MIQDVKLGTHKIGTYTYAINNGPTSVLLFGNAATNCLFDDFFLKRIVKKAIKVGVERGVATRGAQVVWPMMIVTVTNFEGFTRQQF